MNILSQKNKSDIRTQREDLLKQNPDLLFGVYSLISDNDGFIELELIEDYLCLYPNQERNLRGLSENNEIHLLDINALRKGEAKKLDGTVIKMLNPVLLSGGVIEVYGATTHAKTRDHILLTLRDGGTVDSLQYTSIAGRNIGTNLTEEALREQMEESPFLLMDNNGNYTLGVRSNDPKHIRYLQGSIDSWISKIEGWKNDPLKSADIKEAEKMVKKLFPKIGSIKTMIDILKDIVARESYSVYSYKTLDTYPGIEQDIKTIIIGNHSGTYFVYQDKDNNTIEYRTLERIVDIPPGSKMAGIGTSRLYLESINQRPNTRRLEVDNKFQSSKKVVPTVGYFINTVLSKNSSN